MVDPTSSPRSEEAPACETCGDPIVEDPDHVVETWVDEGSVASRHFCSEGCRDEF